MQADIASSLPSLAPPSDGQAAAAPRGTIGFGLLLVVTAVLCIRPAELLPSLANWPIYEVAILACLAAALSVFLQQLTAESLISRPEALCVIGLLPVMVLSSLLHGQAEEAFTYGVDWLKIIIYYLLLRGLVDSPFRIKVFLMAVGVFALVVAVLTLLNYRGVISFASLGFIGRPVEGAEVPEAAGDAVRLGGVGSYSDPNDFAGILNVAIYSTLPFVFRRGQWLAKAPLLAMLGVFGYAMMMTRSRGGFLGMLAGLLILLVSRFGWRRAVPLAAVALPLAFYVFGGRQTNIDLSDTRDTAQGRVQLWADGLEMFKTAPLLGIGREMYVRNTKYVAHNAYIHCYAELGLAGGTLFVGAMGLPLLALWRLSRRPASQLPPELGRLRPWMMAAHGAYAVSMFSLSLTYLVFTYMVLGLTHAYCSLAAARVPEVSQRLDGRTIKRVLAMSFSVLLALYLFIRAFLRY